MTDEQPTDDRWLTYIEAGELLSLSPEAVRSIARRQKWPRQSPNAVGKVVRVLVPGDRLRPVADRRERPVSPNGHNRSADLREMAELFIAPLRDELERAERRAEAAEGRVREQVADLKTQLAAEQKRGDLYKHQARDAERRVRELQEQLQAEMIEHRRVVSLMAESLAARRSWWRWRRRS
jgi:hypothetical protein